MFVLFVITAETLQPLPVTTKLSILLVPLVLKVPLMALVLVFTILKITEAWLFKAGVELKSK